MTDNQIFIELVNDILDEFEDCENNVPNFVECVENNLVYDYQAMAVLRQSFCDFAEILNNETIWQFAVRNLVDHILDEYDPLSTR